MRKQLALTLKGTALIAVLFCSGLEARAENVSPAKVTVINNAALQTGQSIGIKGYKVTADRERLVKNMAVGPVEADCANGCGSTPANFTSGPGDYRIEVHTDAGTEHGFSAVTFNLKEGEEYMWMVTNRANPKASNATAADVKIVSDAGPYRIDLVAYTEPVKLARPASLPPKQENKGFWPFKPVNNGRSALNK